MATYAEFMDAARRADAAGDSYAAKRFLELALEQKPQKPQAEQGRTLIATVGKDGKIFKDGNGAMSFTSPGYSTNDPERVAQLMKGATPAEVAQSTTDQLTIAQNPFAARAQQVVEGAPFIGSYADEAVGTVNPRARDAMRATSGAMRREKPGESLGLNLAGSVAGAVPMAVAAGPAAMAKVAQAGSKVGQSARAGLLGALTGGTEGVVYGAGEGKTGDERADNAASQGVLGSVFGGVLGAGAPVVESMARNVIEGLRKSDVAAISKRFGISKNAAKVIKQYIDADDIAGAQRAIQAAGDEAMLGETSKGAMSLLDAAAASGGKAEGVVNDAIEGRVSRANGAFRTAADDTLGAPVGGMRTAADEISARTAPQRQAAYDAAYASPIDYAAPEGRAIEEVLSRIDPATLGKAVRKANERIAWDGKGAKQIMAKLDADGNLIGFEELPNVRQLDILKRSLQEVAEGDRNALGRMGPEGTFRSEQARAVRDATARAAPAYGDAVAIGGDKIAEENALMIGNNLLRTSTKREDVARAMVGASVDERAAAKAGLRQAIDDTMADVRAAISDPNVEARQVRKILGDLSSQSSRDKVRMVLGEDEAAKLFERIDTLATGFNLRAAVSENSRTARRQAIQSTVSDVANPNTGPVGKLKEGSPIGAVQDVVRLATANTPEAQAMREAGVWEDIAKVLTGVKGNSAAEAMKFIRKAADGQVLTEAEATTLARLLASTGVLAGSRSKQQQISMQ